MTRNISLLPLWTVSARQGPVPDLLNQSKKNWEYLFALSLDCLCRSGQRNQLIMLGQVSFPGQEISPFTGLFCKSCLSVESCSLLLLGPYRGGVSKILFKLNNLIIILQLCF